MIVLIKQNKKLSAFPGGGEQREKEFFPISSKGDQRRRPA